VGWSCDHGEDFKPTGAQKLNALLIAGNASIDSVRQANAGNAGALARTACTARSICYPHWTRLRGFALNAGEGARVPSNKWRVPEKLHRAVRNVTRSQ
jgi:hypothetical protein